MIRDRKEILLKGYVIAALLIIMGVGVLYNLLNLQFNQEEREKFEEFAQRTNFREAEIPAQRGNLYAADGSLLATSVRKYDIAIDGMSMRQELIDRDLNALCDSLQAMFGKPSKEYAKTILFAKANDKQYQRIEKGLNYTDLERIKNFPIFKEGQIKGGLIVEDRLVRERSVKDIGARTLGYVKDSLRVGLEGAYNSLLAGINGKRFEQRMGGGNWRPININAEVEAEEGYDVVTTIDIGLQNVAYNSLYKQLEEFKAQHGTVVVMEVATGEVKAIANLLRMEDGSYADVQNFAVGEAAEPGSTIKTMSLLAALDDGVVDTATMVSTGGGRFRLHNRNISDTRGYGNINVRQVLEKSSNIGTAKIVDQYYIRTPEKFMNKLAKTWKLGEPLEVDIPGEAQPFLPNPDLKSWSKQSLSSVSFGYESKLTPLQILTFYNGIANDGVMLKPLFVKEIRRRGEVVKAFEPEVRVKKMAADSTIKKMQNMLASVVLRGTGRAFYNEKYLAAGKTGTARVEYWVKDQPMQYRASFAGYFPADEPKYSCIVVIHKPSPRKGYYGGSVAGPVFHALMEKVYVSTPKIYQDSLQTHHERKAPLVRKLEMKPDAKVIPDLRGKKAYEAIAALENAGLHVSYTGNGVVTEQSVSPGTALRRNSKIHLTMSHL
ncbi:MAG: penicillin-binding protein [Weeksellaceae bacterium]|nr:penicillin-binding protein [Weeksellaceae bacterium]